MPATSESVTIAAGPLAVELVPSIGGSVASFRLDGIDLMRPLSADNRAAGNVLGVAMFPMMPYANRIADNAFTFRGRTYRFATNNPPEIFNVHGTGWHLPWQVVRASGDTVELGLEVTDAESYSYRATQLFALDDDGLSVTLTMTNAGAETMPFGFGLHPWFDRDADVELQFHATRFYLEEPDAVPGEGVTLPPELAFDTPGPLPRRWRCNDYGGWDGVATLRFPARGVGLTMRAEPLFGHLQVYADPRREFFCVEPQSNASGAFTRDGGFEDPDEGVAILEPGQSLTGSVRFAAFRT